jgi:hypothetical protein
MGGDISFIVEHPGFVGDPEKNSVQADGRGRTIPGECISLRLSVSMVDGECNDINISPDQNAASEKNVYSISDSRISNQLICFQ